MEFRQLSDRALEIREKYAQLEMKKIGRTWTRSEVMQGFVVDVGELMELVMAKEGIRNSEEVDKRLAHEMADCLWSLLVLARKFEIDLEKEFNFTMNDLEQKIEKNLVVN